jgi:hypothetical protein
MSEYIPDPVDLFHQHEAEQQRKLDRLPVCVECEEAIQDDIFYIFDSEIICPDCLKHNHRKWVDDYAK